MNFSRAASLTHDPGSPSGAEPAAPVMRLIPSMSLVLLAAQPAVVMVRVYHQRIGRSRGGRWAGAEAGRAGGAAAADRGRAGADGRQTGAACRRDARDRGRGRRVPAAGPV